MHFYSLHSYGSMIRDSVRTDAYARALRYCVKPGSIVLDIGTGVGIWALLACQFGARKVYAIEPNDAIYIAREMAAANGYADRIEFIQDMSTQVKPPEQADIVVSDMRGVLPVYEQHLSSIIDVRRRLLAPGGVMIPQRDTLWIAAVEAPDLYKKHTVPWDGNPYGFDMRIALPVTTNTWTALSRAKMLGYAGLSYVGDDRCQRRGDLDCSTSRDWPWIHCLVRYRPQ
jgi:predicted nicotinamide N-methyase